MGCAVTVAEGMGQKRPPGGHFVQCAISAVIVLDCESVAMQLRCPHCQARLGLFADSGHQKRVRNGACPHCGQKVSIGASGKVLALVAPMIALLTWLAWGLLPPAMLGLGAGALIWATAVRLDKAP